MRWDSVVEKVWTGIGGNQEEILLSIEKFAGYKTEVKERIELRERLALRNELKEEEHLRDIRGGYEKRLECRLYSRGPMNYANALKLRVRVGDLELPERRKRYTRSRAEEKMHRCALVAKQ